MHVIVLWKWTVKFRTSSIPHKIAFIETKLHKLLILNVFIFLRLDRWILYIMFI